MKEVVRVRFANGGTWKLRADGKPIGFHFANPNPGADQMLVTVRASRGVVRVGVRTGRELSVPLGFQGVAFDLASTSAGTSKVEVMVGDTVLATGVVLFVGTEVTMAKGALWRVGRILLLLLIVNGFLLGSGGGPGANVLPASSMAPYLGVGERFFYWKPARLREPVRGDVVVFWREVDAELLARIRGAHRGKKVKLLFVKRVVGVPGDEVRVEGDRVWINGDLLDEPYATKGTTRAMVVGPVRVPEGHFFVMGDNRPQSEDSRLWVTLQTGGEVAVEGMPGLADESGGFIPRAAIAGRPFLAYWPLTTFRWLRIRPLPASPDA
ncbi:signal peptidase I [bacterium]|nr:signal peptidase I [bacterium]